MGCVILPLLELKSHCYDVLVQIERLQAELQATNKAIAEYKEPEEPVEKPLKEK